MKYMLLMYAEEGVWPAAEHREALEESIDICHDLNVKGSYLSAAPLHPPTTATRVAVRAGKRVVLDGPFAEAKEYLGGYFLIDVDTLDEAIAVAARIPGARRGTAEIRPVEDLPIDLNPSRSPSTVIPSFASDSLANCNVDDLAGKRTKYMLLIHTAEEAWTVEERQDCIEESMGLCQELESSGQFVAASPLQSVRVATSVRVRDGKPIVTDGPFAETKEHLGGYFIIQVDNLEDAISIAARIPGAQKGSVEIRPIIELSRLPQRR